MGAGIVQVSIDKGYNVVLKDTTEQGLIRGVTQIENGLINAVKRKKLSELVIFFWCFHTKRLYFTVFNSDIFFYQH